MTTLKKVMIVDNEPDILGTIDCAGKPWIQGSLLYGPSESLAGVQR